MKRILIGSITTAHGVRGDVKVRCMIEDTDLLLRPEGVFTSQSKPDRVFLTYKNDLKGDVIVCTVKGVTDRNAAERLRGTSLYIEEADLPALDEDTIYMRELEGMEAVTPEGKALGTVLGVRNYGASDLLELRRGAENYFIPFCAPYLVNVDKAARRITINEPEVL
ncbi:MAG: 16S rRNA processing protein RimM [Alphaproteobacteria bacterium]|nr:16S rRNA processing protein RimM [Alphaproteobacteria bacterium]